MTTLACAAGGISSECCSFLAAEPRADAPQPRKYPGHNNLASYAGYDYSERDSPSRLRNSLLTNMALSIITATVATYGL